MYHQEERILVNKIISVFQMFVGVELRRVVTADIHKKCIYNTCITYTFLDGSERTYALLCSFLKVSFRQVNQGSSEWQQIYQKRTKKKKQANTY